MSKRTRRPKRLDWFASAAAEIGASIAITWERGGRKIRVAASAAGDDAPVVERFLDLNLVHSSPPHFSLGFECFAALRLVVEQVLADAQEAQP